MKCWYESYEDLQSSGSLIAGVLIEETQVKEKVEELQESWDKVDAKWDELNKKLLAHKQYQLWLRDAEVVISWLSTR